ncbi:hypothetical protein C5167_000799, partial [Papaver somniferum]
PWSPDQAFPQPVTSFETLSFSHSTVVSLVRFRSVYVQYIHSSSSSSFVVNYLINSPSKTVNFETSSNPDSVLDLLENHGFTKPYISKLITWYPKILKFGIQKNLKPKFDFFKSKGLSGIDLAEFFLSCDPRVLETSLQDKIIPCCDTLKNIVQFDKNVVVIIRRHPWILTGNVYLKNLMVNIELLRDEAMTNATWETKVNTWGWTGEDIQDAFRKHPQCMMQSEKKIMSTMDFLLFLVIAWRRGLSQIKEQISLRSLFVPPDKLFLERHVSKHEVQVPELSKVLQWLQNDASQFRGLVLRLSSTQIHWQQKLSVSELELSGQSKRGGAHTYQQKKGRSPGEFGIFLNPLRHVQEYCNRRIRGDGDDAGPDSNLVNLVGAS